MRTLAEARRERAELLREIRRIEKRKDRAALFGLRERVRAARRARMAAIAQARAACRIRRKVPTLKEARAMLAAARAQAKEQCAVDLGKARALKDAHARARAELRAEARHQRTLRRIEQGNKAREAQRSKRSTARERAQESDDEVRGNIPPELVPLFDRVKRQIKGSARQSRTEAFLAYAEEHPGEELAAIEDKTDAMIREYEARMRNPKKSKKSKATKKQAKVEGEVTRLRKRVRELRAEMKEKRNPRRPPGLWWQSCLASVTAQRHARDPAAVCGAAWWKKPARERARIVRKMERGTPATQRAAVAIAKAERNRHVATRGAKGKKSKPRKNPPRELVSLVYLEQKPGDRKPYEYEHDFEGSRPRLDMKGGRLRIRGGDYTTKNGWIYG